MSVCLHVCMSVMSLDCGLPGRVTAIRLNPATGELCGFRPLIFVVGWRVAGLYPAPRAASTTLK